MVGLTSTRKQAGHDHVTTLQLYAMLSKFEVLRGLVQEMLCLGAADLFICL